MWQIVAPAGDVSSDGRGSVSAEPEEDEEEDEDVVLSVLRPELVLSLQATPTRKSDAESTATAMPDRARRMPRQTGRVSKDSVSAGSGHSQATDDARLRENRGACVDVETTTGARSEGEDAERPSERAGVRRASS